MHAFTNYLISNLLLNQFINNTTYHFTEFYSLLNSAMRRGTAAPCFGFRRFGKLVPEFDSATKMEAKWSRCGATADVKWDAKWRHMGATWGRT